MKIVLHDNFKSVKECQCTRATVYDSNGHIVAVIVEPEPNVTYISRFGDEDFYGWLKTFKLEPPTFVGNPEILSNKTILPKGAALDTFCSEKTNSKIIQLG